MLARLFNNLSVQSLAASLIVSFLLIGVGVFFNDFHYTTMKLPGFTIQVAPVIFQYSSLILIPVFSAWFNSVLISNGHLKGSHYLVPILSVCIYLFAAYSNQPAMLLATPLIIVIFQHFFAMIKATAGVLHILFNISFLAGLLSFYFPPALIFILLCWAAALLFGHFNLRTFLVPVIGLFAFYFLVFSLYFFFTPFSFIEEFWNLLSLYSWRGFDWDWNSLWPFGFLLLVMLMAIAEYAKALNYAKIQKRQFLNFNMVLIVLGCLLAIIWKGPWASMIITAFGVSVFLSNLVQYVSRWWLKDLVYLSLILTFLFVIL